MSPGFAEIIVIALFAAAVFAPKKLPGLARAAWRRAGKARGQK